ncbi:MAG: autotransporter outer membrane beta-barrel domain-containing protein [Erythrobacter sp. 34-65-8]|nr:MAG: autotransporter outer membrane beta-barrel domain-containing protein [Erythrobacter sp. 34-65-8]
MKKTIAALLAGSTFLVAVPASAQAVDESPFTGLRVQAVTGYDSVTAGSDDDDDINDNNDQTADGILYGAAVGYDIDFGGVVVGPEAEFTFSSADTDFNDGDFENFGFGNVSAERDLYLGARIGAKVGENALAYVKGGYTNATFDIRSNDGTREFREGYDTDGYRIGGGVEVALSQNMFINAEYRYSNYSKAEVDFEGTLPDTERFNVDLDRHQVAVGLGMRF